MSLKDHGTTGPQDHGTTGPQDHGYHGTTRPRDHKTTGPQDHRDPSSKSSRPSRSMSRPAPKAFGGGQWSVFFRFIGKNAKACVLLLAILATTGCAGYKLGPVNRMAGGSRSVQIAPFANKTLEPRLTDALAIEMRRELQRDGTFRLATHGDGDIVVTGVLTNFNRHEMSFAPTDVLTVRDYRLSLTALVTATDRVAGKTLLNAKPVTGYTLIRVGSDLTSSERQALPLLAADLAKHVTELLSEGAW